MKTAKKTYTVNFRIEEGMRKMLDSMALSSGSSMTDVVMKALQSYHPENISVRPSSEDQARIQRFCLALGCSPNFLLRCALTNYLDDIDANGVKMTLEVAPARIKEFVYPPKPEAELAVAETEQRPATPPPRPVSYGPKKTFKPKKQ